jgi:nucleoside phosphorylase
MIKIIIVDDNPIKTNAILSQIKNYPDIKEDNLETCPDLISAKRLIKKNQYDLMILDLQLPMRFGEQPKSDAGATFLEEISSSVVYKKPLHIIGMTSHEELKTQFTDKFDIWALIQYNETSTEWKEKLNGKLSYLIQTKLEDEQQPESYEYDIAILTALATPELRAVLDLDANWVEAPVKDDQTTKYYKGVIRNGKRSLRVVAAAAPQMGMSAAAVLSTKLIYKFKPMYIVMLGIAAGIRGKGNYGDILVVEQSWDYGSGKNKYDENKKKSIFEPDPRPISLDPDIQSKFLNAIATKKYLSEIQDSWRGIEITTKLQAIIGPVASGSAVLENINLIEEQI